MLAALVLLARGSELSSLTTAEKGCMDCLLDPGGEKAEGAGLTGLPGGPNFGGFVPSFQTELHFRLALRPRGALPRPRGEGPDPRAGRRRPR